MKSLKRIIITAIFVFTIGLLSAQTPPPPNNGNRKPNGKNTPVGGGAPIGSGLIILLGLGAAYGGEKIFDLATERDQCGEQ